MCFHFPGPVRRTEMLALRVAVCFTLSETSKQVPKDLFQWDHWALGDRHARAQRAPVRVTNGWQGWPVLGDASGAQALGGEGFRLWNTAAVGSSPGSDSHSCQPEKTADPKPWFPRGKTGTVIMSSSCVCRELHGVINIKVFYKCLLLLVTSVFYNQKQWMQKSCDHYSFPHVRNLNSRPQESLWSWKIFRIN